MSKNHGITRREWAGLAAGALAAIPLGFSQLRAQAQAADPVLDIAEWYFYYYGIQHVPQGRGTGLDGGHIYVEHWIPKDVRHPYPVVLVHGGNRQAIDWLTTPDGRRGWASLLIEQGYKVYIVDRPGQGRCPYNPNVHGAFSPQTQTFEDATSDVRSSQWPGSGAPDSVEIAQFTSAACQPPQSGDKLQQFWTSRGVALLEDIGPSIFITHGDGSLLATGTATARPDLVKGIAMIEPDRLAETPGVTAKQFSFRDTGNGRFPHLEKNNRDTLKPVLEWMGSVAEAGVAKTVTPGIDPAHNVEPTGFRLRGQGHFWVGVQSKKMPYGTIPMGQMFVQYMLPEKKTRPLPVVMVHGGGGQGTHMMGIDRRPGWVHFWVQSGYDVYWVDRPSYGRAPYHPDALGTSHAPAMLTYEPFVNHPAVFATGQWPGPGGINDPAIDQFIACERGNTRDEVLHSNLVWPGGAELLDRIGPCILFVHAFGGFFAWGVTDLRPDLVKGIVCMEINGDPFARQLRWGLTAAPITFDPPVATVEDFQLVNVTPPEDSPLPIANPYKLQAEPAHQWPKLRGKKVGWITSEHGAGGSPVAQVAFLKQVGVDAEMIRLRDYGIHGNGNLMLMERNNHEIYRVTQDWLDANIPENRPR